MTVIKPSTPQEYLARRRQRLVPVSEEMEVQNVPTTEVIGAEMQYLSQITLIERKLDQHVASIRTMTATSDLNNAARVQNTYLRTSADLLWQFLNPSTGYVIPGFPVDSATIDEYDEDELDALLKQLGVQTADGAIGVEAKKKMLRVHIGLRPVRLEFM